MTIAVFGSINMDVTAYMPRLPKPGETLQGREYKLGLGGKGANQAVAARKLGSEVAFICRLGNDDFAEPAERAEISGHYHPKASLKGTSRPCFLLDSCRLILPAYGTYTGGLRSHDSALQSLMQNGALAILTGMKAIPVPL